MRGKVLLLAALATQPAAAQSLPKRGMDAGPITGEFEFLQLIPAPDCGAFAPFVRPQTSPSAASVAAVAAAVNGLAGLPEAADQPGCVADPLERIGSDAWRAMSAEGGAGVTLARLADLTAAAVEASGPSGHAVRSGQPPANGLEAARSCATG